VPEMPSIEEGLTAIAAGRREDPLAPVTVIVPTHVAGLQLRRRLAAIGPFAGVRFETLPRIAELLAAGDLAAAGRTPLARPIADYVTGQIARESRGSLGAIGDLPGYARVLRRMFTRLRRAGVRDAADVPADASGHLREIFRLYAEFRSRTAAFYDAEDLYDAAAAAAGRGDLASDLGSIYNAAPEPDTAAGAAFLDALEANSGEFVRLSMSIEQGSPAVRVMLSPDPGSETREVVRDVLAALEGGLGLHEIAVFHGAGAGYSKLLREAFHLAGVPAAYLPGVPVIETPAGRAALGLAMLPDKDYARAALFDVFTAGALRNRLPGRHGPVDAFTTRWDRLAREAGVTHGHDRWHSGLVAYVADKDADLLHPRAEAEAVKNAIERDRKFAEDLLSVVDALVGRLDPLRPEQPATALISAFKALLGDYLQRDAYGRDQVDHEIDQIGTVGAVDASLDLAAFARALKANLEIASVRERGLGEGVLVADYRTAGALSFKHVVLCGAYEGGLPAGPGSDALVGEGAWSRMRERLPFLDDAERRLERNEEAARQAAATAGSGTLVWSCPLGELGGTREYYPSPIMVEAARLRDPTITTATELCRKGPADWLVREHSAFAARLTGAPIDTGEAGLREAVDQRQRGITVGPGNRRRGAVALVRARRDRRFTEWDGNLSALAGDPWLDLSAAVSPTVLEDYGTCGFRFLCRSLLRLEAVEDPEEQDVIGAAVKGSLVHSVLQRFFEEQQQRGRPALDESWNEDDRKRLAEIADEELAAARTRGLTGLEIYNQYETRILRQDLMEFLERDTKFRREHGLVPSQFEARIAGVDVAGATLRGIVDRVDRTPDGRTAWVIDYKTGGRFSYKDISGDDPLAGGRKVQLPVYVYAASDAQDVRAAYWFISRREDYEFVEYHPTPENQQRFERTLTAIMDGVRAGAFPAVPGQEDSGGFSNCRFCNYDRICSRRRGDEWSAKLGDDAYQPWLRVEQVARSTPSR
jgi:ATP-dependent helicase/nuclease subunit B